MIDAVNSPVAPRVTSPCTGEVVQLVDEIELLLARGEPVSVQIDGENTRAALEHLAATLPDAITDGRLRLEDDTLPLDTGNPIVVVRTAHESQCDIVLRLALWSRDDFIEYLLAKHPAQCASVMSRLKNANHLLAGGSPTVWRIILDRMAGDETKADIETIVVNELHSRLATEGLAKAIADRLIFPAARSEVGVFGHPGVDDSDDTNILLSRSHSSIRKFLKHEEVRRLFAMERFVDRLRTGSVGEMRFLLSGPTRLGHWRAVSKRVAGNSEVETNLQTLFDQNRRHVTANCATLLSMCQSDWRPRGKQMKLYGGRFQNVVWPDIDLREADLRKASFAAANLRGARFGDAEISGVDFSDANLSLADFGCMSDSSESESPSNKQENSTREGKRKNLKPRGQLQNKIMEYAKLRFHSRTSFVDAELTGANLSGCRFRGVDFRGANLTNVIARRAEFHGLNLGGASLVNADFSGATIQYVNLEAVDLDGCDFQGLRAIGKLELGGIEARKVAFDGAKLTESDWTGSVLRRCDFSGADLSGARMAEINWEDCDLREADLCGATFHMGSTRCGLVDSPYPSHGTRTGFYTDEYDEQYFQNPETIRKACLVGADLRGANIEGVDFYLVDLRGAKFDRAHREQLVSTGAILDN